MKYRMKKVPHTPFDGDVLHEECGVFGIYRAESDEELSPAHETHTALFALQHRGQESCGIAVNCNGVIHCHKDNGLLTDVFDAAKLDKLAGNMAIGHVRYGSQLQKSRENAQPIVITHVKGNLALAFNGAISNAHILRREFEMNGGLFRSNSDAEVLSYTIVQERLRTGSIEEAVAAAMQRLQGAYSMILMSPRKMIAVRDPHGIRPLCFGKLGDSYVFASESCAIDSIGAAFIRDVKPGEIIVVEDGVLRSIDTGLSQKTAACVFEYIYFARPDSVIDGASVEMARQNAGKFLALEHPVAADVVIGVPDSGIPAAIGYSKCSGIPYGVGLIKNRYIARTFIQPTQKQRERAVKIKLNALAEAVRGKRVIMVDDSIVRGTTCARIVNILREAGATEVHMRVSSPPFLHPCYFGTDVPSNDALIAHGRTVEEIRDIIGVDSLGFLSLYATHKIAQGASVQFCDACFSGKYPIEIPGEPEPNMFEREITK